jgi:hypothetical protein
MAGFLFAHGEHIFSTPPLATVAFSTLSPLKVVAILFPAYYHSTVRRQKGQTNEDNTTDSPDEERKRHLVSRLRRQWQTPMEDNKVQNEGGCPGFPEIICPGGGNTTLRASLV